MVVVYVLIQIKLLGTAAVIRVNCMHVDIAGVQSILLIFYFYFVNTLSDIIFFIYIMYMSIY